MQEALHLPEDKIVEAGPPFAVTIERYENGDTALWSVRLRGPALKFHVDPEVEFIQVAETAELVHRWKSAKDRGDDQREAMARLLLRLPAQTIIEPELRAQIMV